jgi:hypothetical protein
MKMRKMRRAFIALLFIGAALIVAVVRFPQRLPGGENIVQRVRGKATVSDRLNQFGATARERWTPYFEKAGVSYPPAKIVLVGLKEERRLEVYAANEDEKLKFVREFPVLGASGQLGPKQREGDFQVPEGVYRIESLNPNSAFHLSLRVNYPNDFDRAQAAREGRGNLGGNIMIHGKSASVGCLAMGDEAAEDLFCLAAEKWPQEIEVLLCPRDLRSQPAPKAEPAWSKEIYADLKRELAKLPK